MVAYSMFAPAISAMQAQSLSFQGISDNITNSTTPGYKAGQIRFQEMVVSEKRGNSFSQLLGTQPAQQIFRDRDGVIAGSNRRLDGALSGSGFFITSTALSPNDQSLELTDAGRFEEVLVDNGGNEEVYLRDIKGNFLLGWSFDPATGEFDIDTNSTASLNPIRVDQEGNFFDAVATTNAALSVNLPATATAGQTFDFDLPIFDGTGNADGVDDTRQLIASFAKDAAVNTWNLTLSGPNGTVSTPAVQPVPVVFDANGLIQSVNGVAGSSLNVTVDWANPTVSTPLTFDLSDSTQFGTESAQIDLNTNGNPDGRLQSVSFSDYGTIQGVFSNGKQRPLARIAMADVIEPNRLLDAGETHFRVGPNSGPIQLFDLENTTRAIFSPNALEGSTTDLANEFSNLIITQRAYSSAATNLKTVDEMVRTATELKQ